MPFNNKKRNTEKEIYYQFADYMYIVCYRYTGNKEVTEELLNNGFLKVFRYYHRFVERHENSLMFWIKKIIVNECLMFLRKKNEFELIQIESVTDNEATYYTESFDNNDILNLIKNLPVGYRTVFNLYAMEGYTHKEIAEKLGIGESTSRSQLTMARKLLKGKLIKIGYETAGK